MDRTILRIGAMGLFLALMAAHSAAAAQVACPTDKRLSFYPLLGGTVIDSNKLATAPYKIRIGNVNTSDGKPRAIAEITNLNTGTCGSYRISDDDGATFLAGLRRPVRLCMGPYADDVRKIWTPSTLCDWGGSFTPLVHNGHQVRIHLNDGNDIGEGGNGINSIYGGSGGDVISNAHGYNDYAYGENSSDTLNCASLLHICDAGSGPDGLLAATDAITLTSGSNTDVVRTCITQTEIDCGSNIDHAFLAPGVNPTGCENVDYSQCP